MIDGKIIVAIKGKVISLKLDPLVGIVYINGSPLVLNSKGDLATLFKQIEKFLSDNDETADKSFHHFLKDVSAELIDPKDLPFYKDEIFFNVNNPDDYSLILSEYY